MRRHTGVQASTRPLPLSLCLVASSTTLACQRSEARFTEPMTLGGRTVEPEVLQKGHDLYRIHCVSCHGETGAGDGPAAHGLKYPPRDFRSAEFSFVSEGALPSHEQLVDRIRTGVPDRGMPTWKGMRDEDLSALADYIKTFSPRWQEADHGS
jgi:mono/diheme cytochrome c family protein